MFAARRCRKPEHDLRARRRRLVGVSLGVAEDCGDRSEIGLSVEPQPQFLLGEPELALGGGVEFGARLEELGRHAELLGEHPQRLHRRRPGACLDPGDVCVGDSGRREVTLRQPLLEPEASQAGADRLPARLRHWAHAAIMPVRTRHRQLGHVT